MQKRVLKKVVYGMSEHSIRQVIKNHEKRGWVKQGQIKKHGYGLGCLMTFDFNAKRRAN